MIIIKDDEKRRGYQLVGNVLFCTFIFKDGTIDSESWYPVNDLTSYHHDLIVKLRDLAGTVNGLNMPIADDGF